jgi:hypothetical protein
MDDVPVLDGGELRGENPNASYVKFVLMRLQFNVSLEFLTYISSKI